ncbi:MAG: hypothetical protein A2161_02150 [Candidatus Schekmanbacteria bacterium RBG_13_48_7]|uniref:Prepilin leader peptidase/N-methyltransferase n=1 Tax=Candidatus Schekmanbacteria bacterium RBG_13_48_7 TaxID=1817878 RepID=A0A1F7RTP3_9BACT|nr:MAG: hypothetical protein A2161_02150 [Candidatus Schekmanbacteria bacterium RBG_13_48_7]
MRFSFVYYVWVFLFGLCFGSFFNVCIYRIPRKKSIVSPSSFCPGCDKPIRFYDNIPLISYFLLGGRCRGCKMQISLRYPNVELLTGILFLLLFQWFGLTPSFFIYSLLISAFIIITFIDIDFQIIPDVITLPLLGFGLVVSWIPDLTVHHWDSLIGALVGGGFLYFIAFLYWLVKKQEGMGGGDIKLMAMAGSFMGPLRVLLAIFLASFLGSVIGMLQLKLSGKGREHPIPFGPYLAVGSVISLFLGDKIIKVFFPSIFFNMFISF